MRPRPLLVEIVPPGGPQASTGQSNRCATSTSRQPSGHCRHCHHWHWQLCGRSEHDKSSTAAITVDLLESRPPDLAGPMTTTRVTADTRVSTQATPPHPGTQAAVSEQ